MNAATITATGVDDDNLAAVVARIDEHERLTRLLKASIRLLENPSHDLWVGMGTDEVLVQGTSLGDLIRQFQRKGIAEGTTVAEFIGAETLDLVL